MNSVPLFSPGDDFLTKVAVADFRNLIAERRILRLDGTVENGFVSLGGGLLYAGVFRRRVGDDLAERNVSGFLNFFGNLRRVAIIEVRASQTGARRGYAFFRGGGFRGLGELLLGGFEIGGRARSDLRFRRLLLVVTLLLRGFVPDLVAGSEVEKVFGNLDYANLAVPSAGHLIARRVIVVFSPLFVIHDVLADLDFRRGSQFVAVFFFGGIQRRGRLGRRARQRDRLQASGRGRNAFFFYDGGSGAVIRSLSLGGLGIGLPFVLLPLLPRTGTEGDGRTEEDRGDGGQLLFHGIRK